MHIEATRLITAARRGSGLTQTELARRAGTSQSTLSAYERGLKTPSLAVAARIVETAGFDLHVSAAPRFTRHTAPRMWPFWVPDRLWRGVLPECFATVVVEDPSCFGVKRWNLRRRGSRRACYATLMRRGTPVEMSTWIDGALLVDLWEDLDIPRPIREAWQPVIDLAGTGPVEHARSTRDAKRTDEVIVADPIMLTRRETYALVAAEERHEACHRQR